MKIQYKTLYKILVLVAVVGVFSFGFFILPNFSQKNVVSKDAVESTLEGSEQIIEVLANSSGYTPSTVNAKAGVPVKFRIKTDGSIGCQNSFRISELKVSKTLSTEVTEIIIPAQAAGKKIVGLCSMAMYKIVLNFN